MEPRTMEKEALEAAAITAFGSLADRLAYAETVRKRFELAMKELLGLKVNVTCSVHGIHQDTTELYEAAVTLDWQPLKRPDGSTICLVSTDAITDFTVYPRVKVEAK